MPGPRRELAASGGLRTAGAWVTVRALIVLALAAGPSPGCRSDPAPPRPSLLLITIDTLRADHVSCYGRSPVSTPNLDRIAQAGARVDRVWSPIPLTTPSHASILSGLYPPSHGVRNNARFRLPGDVPTLAESLKSSGRRTAAFVASFTTSRLFGLDRGFDRYDDDMGYAEGGRPRTQRPAGEVVDRAVSWLEAHAREPFFLWVHLYDPHTPYAPPPPFDRLHPQAPYRGEVAYTDAQVGRLLATLDRARVGSRTVVAVVADHGEGLGEHGESEHGFLLYEQTLHVPFLIAAHRRIPAGSVVAGPASLVDVMPTLLAVLGEPVPQGLQGHNVLAPGAPDRAIYAETLHPYEEFGWSALYALRQGDLKYIEAPRGELYDLHEDPEETANLAVARATLAGRIAQRLRSEAAALVNPGRLAEAVGGISEEVDPEMVARLESLGYVGGGGGVEHGVSEHLPAVTGRNPVEAMDDLRRFDEAQDRLSAGRPEEAVDLLRELEARDPANPQFVMKLAMSLDRAGRHAEAEARFWDLVRRHPTFYLGYRMFSDFLEREGRARESRDLWLRLSGLLPGYVGMEVRIARAEVAAGMPAEGAARLERYLGREPDDAEAWTQLGEARGALGQDAAALEAFRRALELHPTDRQALAGQRRLADGVP